MHKTITAFVSAASVLMLIGGGCAPAAAPVAVEPAPAAAPEAAQAPTAEAPAEAPAPAAEVSAVPSIKTFTVVGDNFKFDVSEMRVKKGDTVRVTFKNMEGFHDWVLDEFGAATAKLQAAQEETLEFVADKAGTFEYYCSVGKHRAMGMKGNLIVE